MSTEFPATNRLGHPRHVQVKAVPCGFPHPPHAEHLLPRPPWEQGGADLFVAEMEFPGGVEPPASAFGGQRSGQLSYGNELKH